jgi:hypothetical protein
MWLVCYDGATEATNGVDEYGEARFIEAVRENMSLTPYKLCTALYASMRAFIGTTEQLDDTTYLAIKRMDRGAPATVHAGAGAERTGRQSAAAASLQTDAHQTFTTEVHAVRRSPP